MGCMELIILQLSRRADASRRTGDGCHICNGGTREGSSIESAGCILERAGNSDWWNEIVECANDSSETWRATPVYSTQHKPNLP